METALFNSEVAEAPERDSDAAVFHRRIEFHLARKPFNGFVSSNTSSNGFKLVTLNPNSDTRKTNGSVNKYEKPELVDSGLDPELSLEITFRRIGAGLRNLGNTCFLNSVLQCLTYTEPLAAYLQSGKHQNSCRTAGFCALCAIQKHVSRALQSTGRILEPKDLVSNLRCISRTFRNARQEDAHEYMVNLLESMHKCCLPTGVPSESASAYEKSLVHKIFGGRLRSQVKCMQCSFCSNKFDPFLDLSLEIQKADTVQKALSHFTAKEQLDGGAKQYQCQQCKQKVRAVKQLTIHKAPHVLTVHLKRFGSHVAGQKIDKRIAFGPTLDLKPFVTGPYDGDLNYTLYGVLVHAGWSTHSGHYYCFIRTSSGMWYSLDDNQVVQVSEKKVMEQKAYMLFYVKDRRKSGTKKPVDIVSSTKKPVDIVQKENMVMNAIGNAAAYSKFNLEVKEKIQNGCVEKTLNGSLANKPKEIPSIKVSVQNVNGTMPVEHSSIVPPTKNSNKEHYNSEMSESKTMPTATIGEASNKINDVKSSKQNNIEESEVGESSMKNGNSITEESNEKKEKLDSVQPEQLSHEIAKKKRPQLKVNKKIFKRQVATMSLSSSIIFGVANMRKKKHKQKKHHSLHKMPPNPSSENDLPSVSDKSVPVPINNCASQKKKAKNGSEDKSQNLSVQSVNDNTSTSNDVTDKEFKKRIVLDGTTLSAPDIRKSAVGNSEEQKTGSKQNDVMSMLTRGLEETTVARWDGIDVSLSEKSEQRATGTTQIGYIGDEWDEEYDKGKRKKIRESKIPFGGPNLFQELATRNTKRKRAKLERFENQPVRI